MVANPDPIEDENVVPATFDGEAIFIEPDGTKAVYSQTDMETVKKLTSELVQGGVMGRPSVKATAQVNESDCIHPEGYPDILLVPDAAKALTRAMEEYGHHVNINYSFRSYEAQKQIFLERYRQQASGSGAYGDVKYWNGVRYVRISSAGSAAVPGTSNHGGGRAVDVDTRRDAGDGTYPDTVVFTGFNDPDRLAFLNVSRKHGWNDTEGKAVGEHWHLTYYPNEDTHKDENVVRYAMGWPVLKKGMIGDDVKTLQEFLASAGYDIGSSGADSSFGPSVEKAVKDYQTCAGLSPDAQVGPGTQDAMKAGTAVPRPETAPPSNSKLNGIDVSHHQPSGTITKVPFDFAIVKATEGASYVDPQFKSMLAEAFAKTNLVGVYHFSRADLGNSAVKEADFFLETVGEYLGRVVLVLDHEAESQNKGGAAWAKQFLDRVYDVTGIRPVIYGSRGVICKSSYASCTDYPLWVAAYPLGYETMGYRQDLNYGNVSPWSAPVLYQYSSSGRLSGYSGNLDINVFYGSAADWQRLASPEGSSGSTDPDNAIGQTTDLAVTAIGPDWVELSWTKALNSDQTAAQFNGQSALTGLGDGSFIRVPSEAVEGGFKAVGNTVQAFGANWDGSEFGDGSNVVTFDLEEYNPDVEWPDIHGPEGTTPGVTPQEPRPEPDPEPEPTPEPEPEPQPDLPHLTVDGDWGSDTTKALQKVMGTTVDGVISNQDTYNKSRVSDNGKLGLSTGWDWQDHPPKGGSSLIAALQTKFGITVDGAAGPDFFKALQAYLGTTPVDGKVSKPSRMVMALQERLNSGTF